LSASGRGAALSRPAASNRETVLCLALGIDPDTATVMPGFMPGIHELLTIQLK
jgi:hypothetical protein